MKDKAIIFDIDGTAVDSPDKKIPTPELVSVMDRLKDEYYLSVATGRVWSFGKSVLSTLHLTDPCIISAGTQICDPVTGKILWQKTISDMSMGKVIEVLNDYPEYKVLYNDGTEDDYFQGGVSSKDFHAIEPVYFFEQVFVPDMIAEEIHAKLMGIEEITCVMVVAQKPGTRDLHIINRHATKEYAVDELLKIIHVDKKNTIGIGDGYNDIHLFNAVHKKVAMGNATQILKNAADVIIGSVKENGMAVFLQTLE
jgi:Cof subfamily protein (haloacid dehalogenase superfamily)